MTDTSREAVEHPLGLIIRLTEDPDTGAWDDPTSSYARGLEAAALIRNLLEERDRALAREAAAYEAAANEVDCGGCGGACVDPSNCHAKDAAEIRALATEPQRAALNRLIAEAEERGAKRAREACAQIADARAEKNADAADRSAHVNSRAMALNRSGEAEAIAAAIRDRETGDE